MPNNIDPTLTSDLREVLDRLSHAQRTWEIQALQDAFRDLATPALVGAFVDFYDAESPALSDFDRIARTLRAAADELEGFGVQPAATGIVAILTISPQGPFTLERNADMAFVLTDVQAVDLSASYVDSAGNPTTVESQTWSSSDDTVLAVTDNGDGTASASAVALGTAQVQLSADAAMGDEVVTIQGILDVEVVAGQAVTATITPGTPHDITPPA